MRGRRKVQRKFGAVLRVQKWKRRTGGFHVGALAQYDREWRGGHDTFVSGASKTGVWRTSFWRTAMLRTQWNDKRGSPKLHMCPRARSKPSNSLWPPRELRESRADNENEMQHPSGVICPAGFVQFAEDGALCQTCLAVCYPRDGSNRSGHQFILRIDGEPNKGTKQ